MAVLDRDCGSLGGANNFIGRELRTASATGVSHADQVADADADADGHVVAHSDPHSHARADPSINSDRRADRGCRHGEFYHHLR